jgi:hypothetical protein
MTLGIDGASFLGIGRTVPMVEVAPPNATNGNVDRGIMGRAALDGNVLEGQLSLTMLGLIVLGLAAFYYWTRGSQGGG